MALQIKNIQGSYLPSGEWQSAEETRSILSGPDTARESFFVDGGREGSGGEFSRRTQVAGTPTSPDYGFGFSEQNAGAPALQSPQRQLSPVTSSTATSTTTTPLGPSPTYEAGTFEAPEYDEGAYKAGQQRLAAPGLRRLRDQIRRVQSKTYENPNVKAMTLREALQGYGSGVESILAGAYGRASAEYEKKYSRERDTALINFRNQEAARQANFSTALAAWSKGISTTGGSNAKRTPITPIRTSRRY